MTCFLLLLTLIAYKITILYSFICKNSGPHLNLNKVCADAYITGICSRLSCHLVDRPNPSLSLLEYRVWLNDFVSQSWLWVNNFWICRIWQKHERPPCLISRKPPHEHTPPCPVIYTPVGVCDRGSVGVCRFQVCFCVSSKNTAFTGRFVPRLLHHNSL